MHKFSRAIRNRYPWEASSKGTSVTKLSTKVSVMIDCRSNFLNKDFFFYNSLCKSVVLHDFVVTFALTVTVKVDMILQKHPSHVYRRVRVCTRWPKQASFLKSFMLIFHTFSLTVGSYHTDEKVFHCRSLGSAEELTKGLVERSRAVVLLEWSSVFRIFIHNVKVNIPEKATRQVAVVDRRRRRIPLVTSPTQG